MSLLYKRTECFHIPIDRLSSILSGFGFTCMVGKSSVLLQLEKVKSILFSCFVHNILRMYREMVAIIFSGNS